MQSDRFVVTMVVLHVVTNYVISTTYTTICVVAHFISNHANALLQEKNNHSYLSGFGK